MHSNMSTEHVQDCQWTHAFQRACWPELAKDRNSQSSRADVPITHVVILWSKEGAEPGTYDTVLWATAMTFSGSLSSFTSRPHCDFMVSLSSSPATSNIAMLFTQYSRPDQSTFTLDGQIWMYHGVSDSEPDKSSTSSWVQGNRAKHDPGQLAKQWAVARYFAFIARREIEHVTVFGWNMSAWFSITEVFRSLTTEAYLVLPF